MFGKKVTVKNDIAVLTTTVEAIKPDTGLLLAQGFFSAKADHVEVEVSKEMPVEGEGLGLIIQVTDKKKGQSGVFKVDIAEMVLDLAMDFCEQISKQPANPPVNEPKKQGKSLSDKDVAAMAKKQMSEGNK